MIAMLFLRGFQEKKERKGSGGKEKKEEGAKKKGASPAGRENRYTQNLFSSLSTPPCSASRSVPAAEGSEATSRLHSWKRKKKTREQKERRKRKETRRRS